MKFELDLGARAPIIRSYGNGEFLIGERRITSAVVLNGDAWDTALLPSDPAALDESHLDALAALGPDLILLGTGIIQMFLPPALQARLWSKGIGCEVMTTAAACRSYNVLVAEGRSVAAALYPV